MNRSGLIGTKRKELSHRNKFRLDNKIFRIIGNQIYLFAPWKVDQSRADIQWGVKSLHSPLLGQAP
jgi:hypothetical protein